MSNADPISPGPGRPRVLADPQKRRHLCAMIAVGAGLEAAAKHAGCSPFTVRREAHRDEAFAAQLREAETAAGLAPLQALRRAADTHWRAAAWLLERSFPEQFARRPQRSSTLPDVSSLFDDFAQLLAEECQDPALLDRLRERLLELEESQRDPSARPLEPKTDLDLFQEELQREQAANLAALLRDSRTDSRRGTPTLPKSSLPGSGLSDRSDALPAEPSPSADPSIVSQVLQSVGKYCERKFSETPADRSSETSENKASNADSQAA